MTSDTFALQQILRCDNAREVLDGILKVRLHARAPTSELAGSSVASCQALELDCPSRTTTLHS